MLGMKDYRKITGIHIAGSHSYAHSYGIRVLEGAIDAINERMIKYRSIQRDSPGRFEHRVEFYSERMVELEEAISLLKGCGGKQ